MQSSLPQLKYTAQPSKHKERERVRMREREKGRFDRATNVIKINYERVSSLRCLLRAIKGKHHLFNAISLLDASQSRRHSCCCCSPHPGSCFPDTVTQALRSEHPCHVSCSYFFHLPFTYSKIMPLIMLMISNFVNSKLQTDDASTMPSKRR